MHVDRGIPAFKVRIGIANDVEIAQGMARWIERRKSFPSVPHTRETDTEWWRYKVLSVTILTAARIRARIRVKLGHMWEHGKQDEGVLGGGGSMVSTCGNVGMVETSTYKQRMRAIKRKRGLLDT